MLLLVLVVVVKEVPLVWCARLRLGMFVCGLIVREAREAGNGG